MSERQCDICLGRVDEDGYTIEDCPVAPPATCPSCDNCTCDGSC